MFTASSSSALSKDKGMWGLQLSRPRAESFWGETLHGGRNTSLYAQIVEVHTSTEIQWGKSMQECQQFFKEMLCTFQHKLVPNFPIQEIILFQLFVWK